MLFDFGDIVLVPFPFTCQAASKKRPAVVISSRAYNRVKPEFVVMTVTSKLRAIAALGEIWLQDWRVAGLLKPSAIKPVFATLEQVMVLRQLGCLGRLDEGALRIEIIRRRPNKKGPPVGGPAFCVPTALRQREDFCVPTE